MAKKYATSPIFFRYLGGLDGDADVTDDTVKFDWA